jgi:hypothetical protein
MLIRFGGMADQIRRFVNDQQIGVFENDVEQWRHGKSPEKHHSRLGRKLVTMVFYHNLADVKGNIALPIVLLLVFAASRWPGVMPNNFSAAYAIAFCAGVYFSGWLAWALPLAMLLITDVLINTLHYHVAPLSLAMLSNYVAYAGIIWLGKKMSPRLSWLGLLGGGILGAIIFYVVTNTAAWLQLPYPKTITGWIQALTVGLPDLPPTWTFFRNTLLSGGLFTGLFVAAGKAVETTESEDSEEPEEEPADAEPSRE